ncbi:peptidoglycan -binding protein [Sedimentimonas flavescens]|uniref:Peptidoglycan -binding protein n=1 Tax=Sedimentimonas flavescens TaxID=2851012 RepID=A0ABT2ZX16_9RHOB|nr:peptidoglycan -binding protein [Sedimentimonas flavescens]MCV2878049.1 peptidoglycan -binding protein [Sedimentimonas flavescens]
MALARRNGQKFSAAIWPGFVDAMTALLLVLMFVLTIFMVVQSVLRDTLNTKESELSALSVQVAGLARALALEEERTAQLTGDLDTAREKADAQTALIATLSARIETREAELAEAGQKITAFEAQVASLLSQRDAARADADARAEELRLDRATIEELRGKLKASGDELAAMTLSLEAARQNAEETLTLLAAAEAAKKDLQTQLETRLSDAEKEAALRAVAEQALASEKEISGEAARKVALLNEQIAALRAQLSELQGILDAAQERDAEAQVQVETLGQQLNAALAQVAAEQKRRAQLEEEARKKAEAEAADLAKYRSEFFGRMSELLAGREGVRVVGDRFVFSSEVLFQPGAADLAPEGKAQIARVAETFTELADKIPPQIDWILRVDGHTDNVPLLGTGAFGDNWELSQARALSVVRYMIDDLGFPPYRLAATGFGEFRPVAEGDSPEARAANRRIELKLTER